MGRLSFKFFFGGIIIKYIRVHCCCFTITTVGFPILRPFTILIFFLVPLFEQLASMHVCMLCQASDETDLFQIYCTHLNEAALSFMVHIYTKGTSIGKLIQERPTSPSSVLGHHLYRRLMLSSRNYQ